jgi:hypothetical protein
MLMLGYTLAAALQSVAPHDQLPFLRAAATKKARAASLSVVQSMVEGVDTPVIFSGWDGSNTSGITNSYYNWVPNQYAEGNGTASPSRSMMSDFLNSDYTRYSAVVNCRSVRTFLKNRRVRFGNAEVMKAIEAKDQDVLIVSVSLAALDSTGQHALVTRGQSGTFGGGCGWVLALVRDGAGHWQEAHVAPTWIS